MRTSEVLRAAKGLINSPEKWHQGFYYGGDGSFCALGACMSVVGAGEPVEATNASEDALCEAVRDKFPGDAHKLMSLIVAFNDDERTTHADVMAAFDRAIAAEEAKENPTPAADETLSIMAACDAAAELVTDAIMRQEPDYPRSVVREVAAIEIFAAAQDAARIFPPLTPEVEATWSEAIREALERSDSA